MSANDQWDIGTSVGLTALAVSAGRAIESNREDPLIVDPYAEELVRQADAPVRMPTRPSGGDADDDTERLWEHAARYMGIRTRYFDQYFQQAMSGDIRQAVILASGLDTRPFRLRWPERTRVFEVDQPDVLAFKMDALRRAGAGPNCEHHPVGVDLRDDWEAALCASGFDPDQPTAWLAEGLLPYLPSEALRHVLRTICSLSAPGSSISVEELSHLGHGLDESELSRAVDVLGVDITELMHDEPDRVSVDSWLAERGWGVVTESVEQTSRRYGRELPDWSELLRNQRYIVAHLPGRTAGADEPTHTVVG